MSKIRRTTREPVVLAPRDPRQLPHGVRRRLDHLCDHHRSRGHDPEIVLARRGQTEACVTSTCERVFEFYQLHKELRGREVHVAAFGSPGLLIFAALLRLTRSKVTIDSCDSRVLLLRESASARELDYRMFVAAALQLLMSPFVIISYISRRDAYADRFLTLGEVAIVPPTAPVELHSLPPMPTRQIIGYAVSGDFTSSHTAWGVEALKVAWCRFAIVSDLELHVFGSGASLLDELPQSRTHEFQTDLRNLYTAPFSVIVTNRLTTGIPNKLVEAVAARRPIIAHRSFENLLLAHPWITFYESSNTILDAMLKQAELDLHLPTPRMGWKSSVF